MQYFYFRKDFFSSGVYVSYVEIQGGAAQCCNLLLRL